MDSQPPSRAEYPGLLLVSAATLLLEVTLTRVLSASLWYHFAFMVVSTALFGFGFSGVLLSLWPRWQKLPVPLAALSCPAAFLLGYLLYNLVPFEPFSLGREPLQWLWLALCYLSATLPFFFSGTTIALILTRRPGSIHRLYLFDLCGAATGSLLVAVTLSWLGGAGSVLAAGSLAAAGALLLCWPRRLLSALAVAELLLLGVLSPLAEGLFPVRISQDKIYGPVLAAPGRRLYTAWNSISRVDVVRGNWRSVEQRSILIDTGTALTRLAHPGAPLTQLPPGEKDEDFFYRLFERPRALVVGSGGGREVLMALRDGAQRVVAVEINPDINRLVTEIMADFTGHLYQDARVEWHTDEARSFLRRRDERFDIIHLPHTISNAALTSGSLSLAENHLMTEEAFADYLEHLGPDGVLLVTRPEAHLPRLFVTARAALERAGQQAATNHLLAWKQPENGLSFYAGFALRRRPFLPEEVENFSRVLGRMRMQALYLPGLLENEPYRQLLSAPDPTRVSVPFPAILRPATDDRPFFNQRVELSGLRLADLGAVFSAGRDGRMAIEDRPVAEAALVALLLESVLVAAIFILLPLILLRRREPSGGGRFFKLSAFFFLGLGYIVMEVGLIQRLNLYLGKPVVLFAVVLGTLLFASGLGSALSRRFSSARAPVCAALSVAAVGVLAWLLMPLFTDATLAWPEAARIVAGIVMLFPLGLLMGTPFPLLFRTLEGASYPVRPWAWGINGFASVLGSIGAIILGMALGYGAVLLFGVACYLAAAGCVFWRRA